MLSVKVKNRNRNIYCLGNIDEHTSDSDVETALHNIMEEMESTICTYGSPAFTVTISIEFTELYEDTL